MIKFSKTYRIPFLLTLCLFFVHVLSKDYNSKYEKPIAGDAQAYYAYLPALFIYNDLSYSFLEQINAKYYVPSNTKSFLNDVEDKKVNKTFPGVAILYAPFFLIAHGLAAILGLEADGYSFIYQLLFDIALWFYLLLGLVLLQAVLTKLAFRKVIVEVTTVVLVLATNMFFYSFYDQSVTHIFNFFLINGLVLTCLKFSETSNANLSYIIGLSLGLIAITRPTNVLVFGVLFFFLPSLKFYKTLLKPAIFLRIIAGALPFIIVPFVLWKLQTNHYVVYSYGEEGFDFFNPELYNFLFSFLKGWFVYTPIAFLALAVGFYILFKSDRKKFYSGILFYALSIYVFSSWWCWYYGAGMGQRVMIDHYIILAFILATVFNHYWNKVAGRIVLLSITVLFIGLNIAQAYQIRYGILSNGTPTKAAYLDNFLSFEKRAKVYPYEHWLLEREQGLSLERGSPSIISGNSYYFEDEWALRVQEKEPFSANLILPKFSLRKGSHLIISFKARARTIVKDTRVVYQYNGDFGTFYLAPYLKKDNWIDIDFLIEPMENINEPIELYIWNADSKEKVEVKQFYLRHYFSDGYY